jgi:flagellar protein FlaI
MPAIVLPYKPEKKKPDQKGRLNYNSILQLMSREFQEVARKHPYLLEYLLMLPITEIGMPQYYPELNRSLSNTTDPNIIYPGQNGVFIHILNDQNDGRHTYIPIEPCLADDYSSLMLEFEKKLLHRADILSDINVEDEEEKRALFMKFIAETCSTDKPDAKKTAPVQNKVSKATPLEIFNKFAKYKFGNNFTKLYLTQHQLAALKYLIVRDKIGMGILQPMVTDKYVEDISCSGMGAIFIEHKIFHSVKSVVTYVDHDELDRFVLVMAERVKKPVSVHSPIADATLPDGSRVNIVYGRDISKRGSNFTIRKFSDTPISIIELIEFGTLDYQMAGYLAICLGEGMNLFVCGETASGKTTTLNAITTFIPPNAKIVSIEDTPELQVPHKNWIREVVSSTKEGDDGGVGMFDLLKAALRQRPNEIIVGEIRGVEGSIAFQAMQTGHSVMATFHAASIERLLQRLTGNPINVPKAYMDNLNLAIFQSAVKLPSGKVGRRMISICEIVGYDTVTQAFTFVEIFKWESTTDTFHYSGGGNSYLMEQKIAPKLGIPTSEKKRIYAEIDRRAKILEQLHKKGVTGFYELLAVLAKAQREGRF